jgi:hypothetical protein
MGWRTDSPRDELELARNASQFRGQMHMYRQANPKQPGVAEFEHRTEHGFQAHVEGLYQHARSIDSPSSAPLAAHDKALDESLGQSKAYDLRANYNPDYVEGLKRSVIAGTVDPIHVASGRQMAHDRQYALNNSNARPLADKVKDTHSEHDPWLGNGNHRLVLAHAMGVQFIPAKGGSSRGTGAESAYGGDDTKYGPKRKSWADMNPEAI